MTELDRTTIVQRAVDIFGKERALFWMNAENAALGGKRPRDLLSTLDGLKAINDVLTRVEYGLIE